MNQWTHIPDAAARILVPDTGLKTTLLLEDGGLRVMGLGFAAGHELKSHTAPRPVVLHFLDGEATVFFGEAQIEARPGSLVHIPAQMTHAVTAKTAVRMLLLLLPG